MALLDDRTPVGESAAYSPPDQSPQLDALLMTSKVERTLSARKLCPAPKPLDLRWVDRALHRGLPSEHKILLWDFGRGENQLAVVTLAKALKSGFEKFDVMVR